MAPINTGHQTKPPHVSAAKALPFRDRVTKRPARGFLRFRSGILNVVPKGAERSIVNMNRKSALLRLPTEIRQEIWKYVLGGKTYLASCFSGRYYSESYRFAPSTAEPRNGMSLLRTCRQIYSEAVLYPLREATFAYHNLTYLKRSIKGLRPYHLNNITHIRVDCRRRNRSYYFEDSGLLSNDKLNFAKMFPALTCVTVLIHGITDSEIGFDRELYVTKVEHVPARLRKIVEDTGASLEVTSTHSVVASRAGARL